MTPKPISSPSSFFSIPSARSSFTALASSFVSFASFAAVLAALTLLSGCSAASLQEIRQKEKNGQKEEALQGFRDLAKRSDHPDALLGASEAIRLYVEMARWKELLTEASPMLSLMDKEDPWSRRFQGQPEIGPKSLEAIERSLFQAATKAQEKAQAQGEPLAYVAAGSLFGFYLERFPQRPHRWEASIRRGQALSISSGCREALRLFRGFLHSPKTEQAFLSDQDKGWLTREALRGSVGCDVRLWQEERDEGRDAVLAARKKNQNPLPRDLEKMKGRDFTPIVQEAKRLVSEHPQTTVRDIVSHGDFLQKRGALPQAFQLFLAVIQAAPKQAAAEEARALALQVFGASDDWSPLLDILPQPLPPAQGDIFWERIRSLFLIHGVRQSQVLLREGKAEKAIAHLLQVYEIAPNDPNSSVALYNAGLLLEERGESKKARSVYQKMIDLQPKAPLTMMAIFRFASLFRKEGAEREAALWFEHLGREYAKHPIASRAFYLAWEIYTGQKNAKQSLRLRKLILTSFPTSMEAARLRSFRAPR